MQTGVCTSGSENGLFTLSGLVLVGRFAVFSFKALASYCLLGRNPLEPEKRPSESLSLGQPFPLLGLRFSQLPGGGAVSSATRVLFSKCLVFGSDLTLFYLFASIRPLDTTEGQIHVIWCPYRMTETGIPTFFLFFCRGERVLFSKTGVP